MSKISKNEGINFKNTFPIPKLNENINDGNIFRGKDYKNLFDIIKKY